MSKKRCRREPCEHDCIRGFDICPERVLSNTAAVVGWLAVLATLALAGRLLWFYW